MIRLRTLFAAAAILLQLVALKAAEPHYEAEILFPLEHWHNHGSCVVECPNGDLLVCWFHGSGERTADDVVILGARKVKATGKWTEPFLMADTKDFPDTNCTMIIDPQERLWLMWPTILAHTWESTIMNYKLSSDYQKPEGAPEWNKEKILWMKPSDDFSTVTMRKVEEYLADQPLRAIAKPWVEHVSKQASDELTRRMGWFTRAHPLILDDGRMLVGLYSDGFSFSLVALTDDWGDTWQFSEPIVGGGNIQPSFARKKDGTIVAYMRDNGPPPKRVLVSESADRGMTWSKVYDHPLLPNPGSGLEVANLNDGRFICINNDTQEGRHSLFVSISEDEGQTWAYNRHLELAPRGEGSYGYPSIIQGKDGMIHASYTYVVENPPDGSDNRKSIKHAEFNIEWIMQGDPVQ